MSQRDSAASEIFAGPATSSVQFERSGYGRKPDGTQDQGSKDEND